MDRPTHQWIERRTDIIDRRIDVDPSVLRSIPSVRCSICPMIRRSTHTDGSTANLSNVPRGSTDGQIDGRLRPVADCPPFVRLAPPLCSTAP
eukprot:9298366-Pyramimonas_sp.AAC.1